ncbi:MAG: pyridoxine 5'-phosphate synthase [Gammaproteobacteria bacterium]
MAEKAGADGITVHLREDRRHIQDEDVAILRKNIKTRLNLEMAATDEMVHIATTIQPTFCCLVPEKREELTTEGGLDVASDLERVKQIVRTIKEAEIQCSIFVDPEKKQIDAAKETGADIIEIHTGRYADAGNQCIREKELDRVMQAAHYAHALDLQVNAGHGLNYDNVMQIAKIPEIRELNIGHAIVCQSIYTGLEAAVEQMKYLMNKARGN